MRIIIEDITAKEIADLVVEVRERLKTENTKSLKRNDGEDDWYAKTSCSDAVTSECGWRTSYGAGAKVSETSSQDAKSSEVRAYS